MGSLRRASRFTSVASLASVASLVSVSACGVRSSLFGDYVPPCDDASVTAVDATPPPPPDTDAGIDASPIDAGFDAVPPDRDLGQIVVQNGAGLVVEDGGADQLAIQGAFYPSVSGSGCTLVNVAGCVLSTCGPPTSGFALSNAGTLSFRGGLESIALQPSGNLAYFFHGAQPLFHGGESIAISADGGDVPAFAITAVAPTPITITTPAAAPTTLVRSAPFVLQWTGASAGEIEIDAEGQANDVSVLLECPFDVAAGSATIPTAALSQFPATTGTLAVNTRTRTIAGDGSWTIEAYLETYALTTSGSSFVATVDFR